jgi:hypothetical protein
MAAVVMLAGASVAAASTDCDPQDARPVVEHARKRGYVFELTVTSEEGSCWVDSSGFLLFASATTTGDAACDGRIFARVVAPEAPTAPVISAIGAAAVSTPPPAAAPATVPAWTIVGIRIATPDGGDIFPVEDTRGRRGWTFQLAAPRGTTQQYRIDTVEFRTQEECTQWRNAF